MAIRDGMSIELDEERARKKALDSAPAGKRRRRAVLAGEAPPRRKASVVLAVLAIIFIFLVASAYAFFSLRPTPPEPTIEIDFAKTAYPPGETINATVRLVNPQDGIKRVYELSTSQEFQLQVLNDTGSVVASYNPQVSQVKTRVTADSGQSVTLGAFAWNQTTEAAAGANITYVQVPAGMYTFKVWLNEHPDIWAKRNMVLG